MADEANVAKLVAVFEARFDDLDKQIKKAVASVYGASCDIKKHAQSIDDVLTKVFTRPNFGKGLAVGLEDARAGMLRTASSIPILGAALASLGPVGIAAGGAFLTLNGLMGNTDKAIEYGASVAKVGKEIGVTTDFIQKFNFAAHQSDIDIGVADSALKTLGENLGKVQEGLAKKQMVNGFKAIGFSREQLMGFKNVDELFPLLIENSSRFGTEAERAGTLAKIGIADLAPMLKGGIASWNEMGQKAEDLGIILDGRTIIAMEEAKKKLSEIDDVMKAKANVTFAQFADTLIAVKTAFEKAEEAGLSFLAKVTGTESVDSKVAQLKSGLAALYAQPGFGSNPVAQGLAKQYGARLSALTLVQQIGKDFAPGAPKPPKSTLPTIPGTKPPDHSAEALDQANVAELSAHDQLLHELLTQAHILDEQNRLADEIEKTELERVDAEKKKKDDAAAVAAKLNPARLKLILEANAQAAIDQKATIVAKAQLAARQRELVAREKIVRQADEISSLESQTYSTEAGIAQTLAQRRDLDARALALQQQAETRNLSLDYDKRILSGDATAQDKNAAMSALARSQAASQAALQLQDAGPIQQYVHSLQDLNTLVQQDAVQAFQGLSDSLGQSAANALHLTGALGQFFSQLISQLFQKEANGILTALSSAIPALASGTDSAAGGLTLVGEKGPELVNMRPGSQVIPNDRLSVGGGGSFSISVVPSPYFDVHVTRIAGAQAAGAAIMGHKATIQQLQRNAGRRMGS